MNFKHFIHIGLCTLMAVLLGSCGMMDYSGPDCTTYRRVRFTYDYNMLYADAFPHEVKTLTLYAYNSDGTLVYSHTANADSIIAKGYMEVDDMPAGTYTLKVWAQGEQRHPNTYTFGNAAVGGNQRNLTVRLNADAQMVDHDITPLYYGKLEGADFTEIPTGGTREYTVNLMKDTENFRIVLQNQSGKELPTDSFRFVIREDNSFLDAENNLIPSDSITYNAWSVYNGETSVDDSRATITDLSAVVAEFTTNRLVRTDSLGVKHNMRLHVSRVSDGHEIINVPLTDLCLLVKGNYNRRMTDQEYLDRQDTWNFVFFLDNDRNWLAASIMVQSWRVVLQDADM